MCVGVCVQVEDAGVYTCLVSNLAGEDGRSLWVRVQRECVTAAFVFQYPASFFLYCLYLYHFAVPPMLVGSSDIRTVSVPFKGHLTLECQTDGDPPPKIQWYRDNIKLQVQTDIKHVQGITVNLIFYRIFISVCHSVSLLSLFRWEVGSRALPVVSI